MPDPRIPEIDRVIHEPARLAILTVLSSCESADFLSLRNITGLTSGNLSVQLTRLEEAGLVHISKQIVDRKMSTTASLSKHGTAEIARYWKAIDTLRKRCNPPSRKLLPALRKRGAPA